LAQLAQNLEELVSFFNTVKVSQLSSVEHFNDVKESYSASKQTFEKGKNQHLASQFQVQ
jgi:hypothetical protein